MRQPQTYSITSPNRQNRPNLDSSPVSAHDDRALPPLRFVAVQSFAILANQTMPDANAPQLQPQQTASRELLAAMRRILGPLSKRRTPASSGEDKAALTRILTEKHGL